MLQSRNSEDQSLAPPGHKHGRSEKQGGPFEKSHVRHEDCMQLSNSSCGYGMFDYERNRGFVYQLLAGAQFSAGLTAREGHGLDRHGSKFLV